MFVAARQGPRTLQQHTLAEFPASTTLRQIGRSILPDVELLSVEACKDIDGKPGHFHGCMLDKTVGFVVNQANMMYVKCCFAVSSDEAVSMYVKH